MPARTFLMAGEAEGGVKVVLWGSCPLEHDLNPALTTADIRAEEGYAKYSVLLNMGIRTISLFQLCTNYKNVRFFHL